MSASFSPIVPISGQGMASIDPSMAFSSGNDVARAISLNPNLAAKAVGQVDAGGVPSLGGADSGMSLSGVGKHTPEEMRKVAQQFEAIFLRMLMQQMRASVEKNSAFGNSRAMEMFQSMQDDQFADVMAQKGIGLGDMVYRQMMARQVENNQRVGKTGI